MHVGFCCDDKEGLGAWMEAWMGMVWSVGVFVSEDWLGCMVWSAIMRREVVGSKGYLLDLD